MQVLEAGEWRALSKFWFVLSLQCVIKEHITPYNNISTVNNFDNKCSYSYSARNFVGIIIINFMLQKCLYL